MKTSVAGSLMLASFGMFLRMLNSIANLAQRLARHQSDTATQVPRYATQGGRVAMESQLALHFLIRLHQGSTLFYK
jgi:hypothetical protein